MNAKRLTLILSSAIVALLIGIVAGTHLLSGSLQAESAKLAASKAEAEQLILQKDSIAKSKNDIAKYADLVKITKAIVPQDKNQAATLLEIDNIARASNVSLTTISFASSNLGSTPSSAKPTASATSTLNLSQLTPVKGLAGVYNLQLNVGNNPSNTVTYSQLLSFLRKLETNRRTAAVSSVSIQPQANSPNDLVFNLVINTYIKP